MQWSTACPDWERRILAGQSLVPCPPLFPDEAEAALSIFRDLKIVDALGHPTFGEAARPWVMDFAAAIFGAYDHETGRRLINQFFLLISKKNGKSTIAAGIMLTALLRNWRHSAEFIILAPTIEIANNSAKPAMDMVAYDPELRKILKPIPNRREIRHLTTGATLKIVAADSDVVSGKKATGVLIDELWLFGKIAKAEDMIREATGGLASRPEGFVIALSTQSDEKPTGVFEQWLVRYRKIRDGSLTVPHCLGVLYEFPERMIESRAYEEPGNWYVTNPNLGASVDRQFIQDKFDEAKENGFSSLMGFSAKHLNVQIGTYLGIERWRGADFWDGAVDESLTLESLLERSEVAVVGIDGGGLDDMLGLAVLGRDRKSKDWLLWVHAWVQDDVIGMRPEIQTRLEGFSKDGDLTVCRSATQDVEDVADIVKQVHEAGLLPEKLGVGLDPYAISAIVDALAQRGIEGETLSAIRQGAALSPASWGMERKLKDGTLWHAGQAMMAWCVGNARTEQRGNAVLITKQTAGKAKIDPLVAAFNAVMLMSRNPVVLVADVMAMVA
jgi:phage terminase large subunit-like protein